MLKLTNNNTLEAVDRETMKDKLLSQADVGSQNVPPEGPFLSPVEGVDSPLKTSIYGSLVTCTSSSLVYSDVNSNHTSVALDTTWCRETGTPFVADGDLKVSPKIASMADGTHLMSKSPQSRVISDKSRDLSSPVPAPHEESSHIKKAPVDQPPRIQCLACNMTFPSLDAYTDHYQEYHTSVVLASETTMLEDSVPEDLTPASMDHTVPDSIHRHMYQTHPPVHSSTHRHYIADPTLVTTAESSKLNPVLSSSALGIKSETDYNQQLCGMLSGDDILSLAMLSTDIKPLAMDKDGEYAAESPSSVPINTISTAAVPSSELANRADNLYRFMETQVDPNTPSIPHCSALSQPQTTAHSLQSTPGSNTVQVLPSFYHQVTHTSALVPQHPPAASHTGVYHTKLDLSTPGTVPSPADSGSPEGMVVISPISFINMPERKVKHSESEKGDLSTISPDMVASLGLPQATITNSAVKVEPLFTEAQLAKLATVYNAKPDEIAQIAAAMYSVSDRLQPLAPSTTPVEYHAEQITVPVTQPQEAQATAAHSEHPQVTTPSTPTPMEFTPSLPYTPTPASPPADTELFSCPKCDSIFQKKHLLTKHIQVYHRNPISTKGPSTLYCRVCGRGFGRLDALNSHVEGHLVEDTGSSCPVCNIVIHDRQVLIRHIQDHPTRKPFECTMCGKKFSITSSLKKHIKRYHGDDE